MSGTSTTKFTAATTVPNQQSWGSYQRFNFSANEPHVRLQAFSQFAPTAINTSTINIESRNSSYAGFRWHHLSQVTDTNPFGTFTFQSFVSDAAGINIFGFDGTDFNIYYPANLNSNMMINVGNVGIGVSSPLYPLHFASSTADCKIALYSPFGNSYQLYGFGVIPGILKYSVDQSTSSHVFYCGATSASSNELFRIAGTGILTAHNSLNMNSNQINGVVMAGTPAGTDAVNVSYLNSALSSGTIVLTGNVTGSGVVGTSFATTLNMTLDTIPLAVASVSLNGRKIINLATPTSSTDAATKGYVDSATTGGTITLTGNVTGTGTLGTPFATTIATTLNNIPVATGAININSQVIDNVSYLGIQVASPLYPLQFASITDLCKICLYSGAANEFQVYGFGVLGSTLKYTVDQPSSSHVFYCGASSTTSTELFRIAGTGYASVYGGTGTFYSRVPSAHVHMYSNSTSTTNTGVWVKLNGTTISTGAAQCTTSSNRITFTGSDLSAACTGMVSCSATLSVSATSSILIGIYKNGTTLLQAPVGSNANLTAGAGFSVTVPNIMVTLSPGDYVEVWALSSISTGTITTQHLNLAFQAC